MSLRLARRLTFQTSKDVSEVQCFQGQVVVVVVVAVVVVVVTVVTVGRFLFRTV